MNKLEHIDEFRDVLKDYSLSPLAKQHLENVRLVLLVGPSSSGRNTIINELVRTGHYHFFLSDTTRKPRINNGLLEQNGVEYWFRKEEDLLQDLQSGLFLEAAIIHNQQVSGISIRELEAASNAGKMPINEIEIVGAQTIRRLKPDTLFFFILPPSFDEWMARMTARGPISEAETQRRLHSAINEIETALANDYFIFLINDTYMHSVKAVDNIVKTGCIDSKQQEGAKKVALEILADTKKRLSEK